MAKIIELTDIMQFILLFQMMFLTVHCLQHFFMLEIIF